MGHDAAAEESRDAPARPVKELQRKHHVHGAEVLTQRANGAHGENALDSQLLHCIDIGAEIDFRRADDVSTPVPREKSNAPAFKDADAKCIRWFAKGRGNAHPLRSAEPFHLIKSASTDNSNLCFCQFRPPLSDG